MGGMPNLDEFFGDDAAAFSGAGQDTEDVDASVDEADMNFKIALDDDLF